MSDLTRQDHSRGAYLQKLMTNQVCAPVGVDRLLLGAWNFLTPGLNRVDTTGQEGEVAQVKDAQSIFCFKMIL